MRRDRRRGGGRGAGRGHCRGAGRHGRGWSLRSSRCVLPSSRAVVPTCHPRAQFHRGARRHRRAEGEGLRTAHARSRPHVPRHVPGAHSPRAEPCRARAWGHTAPARRERSVGFTHLLAVSRQRGVLVDHSLSRPRLSSRAQAVQPRLVTEFVYRHCPTKADALVYMSMERAENETSGYDAQGVIDALEPLGVRTPPLRPHPPLRSRLLPQPRLTSCAGQGHGRYGR